MVGKQLPFPEMHGNEAGEPLPALPKRGRRPKGMSRVDDVTLPPTTQPPAPEGSATFSRLLEAKASPQPRLNWISPNVIDPNPHQPRKLLDEASLEQLTASIRERGILQPILVARGERGRYVLVAGQRRLAVARRLKLRSVPAMIVDTFDSSSVVDALVENIQRVGLSDVEEGESFLLLYNEYNYSEGDIAARIGKDRSYVSNRVRVATRLSPATKQFIIEANAKAGEEYITRVIFSHAVNRNLASLPAGPQAEAVREIAATATTTREAEAIIRRYQPARRYRRKQVDSDVSAGPQVATASLRVASLLQQANGSVDAAALRAALAADLAALDTLTPNPSPATGRGE